MITNDAVFRALLAYDGHMFGIPDTLPNRVEAMRCALATTRAEVAMCETCFTTWPIVNAPAVCPACTKGRA